MSASSPSSSMGGPAPFHAEPRALGLSGYGYSMLVLHDTLYLFGGPDGSQSQVWSLPVNRLNADELATSLAPVQQSRNNTTAPSLVHAPAIARESSFWVFGSNTNNGSRPTNPLPLYEFTLAEGAWAARTTQNGPPDRLYHTAVEYNNTVFILGGQRNSSGTHDFWQLQWTRLQWQRLRADPAADRFGHTASMLSDGRMVVLGGMHGNTTDLYSLDHALIYDTVHSAWSTQTLRGQPLPSPRMHHSAVTTATNNIVICGGQDGAAPPFHTYASADKKLGDMAALLNTQTWEWTLAHPSADQPLPQAMAAAAIVNGSNLIYGLGVTYQTAHDGLSILDSTSMIWMPKETDGVWMENKPTTSVAWSTWVIVVLALSVAACFGLTCLMFSLGKRIWRVVSVWATSLKMEVWNPRTGEPGWAESTRLTLKTVSLCILTYLVFSLVEQILNSPTIYQKFYQASPDMTIEAPDIRFCFQGPNAHGAYVRCATDYGASCSNYVEAFTPSQAHAGGSPLTQKCFLFRPPSTFKLGPTETRRDQQGDPFRADGSYLKLDYYYPDSSEMTVQLALYHPKHDPNPTVYNLTNPQAFEWDDSHEMMQFRRNTEQRHSDDLLSRDLFMLDPPHRIYTASYTIQERVVLDPASWWNYIGIASQSSRRYALADVAVTAERHAPSYNALPPPVGSLHVYPSRYDTHVVVEQRAFAVVNAIGVLGGLFGLLVTGQTWLFGYRPRSPWGIIQRWSIGQMKYSLLQGLYGTFFRGSRVPIAHPLAEDEDEATVMDERTRLRRLEDRMHTLERLFQAYYIDDEIFRSLDQAFNVDQPRQHNETHLPSSSSVPSTSSSCTPSLRIRNKAEKPT